MKKITKMILSASTCLGLAACQTGGTMDAIKSQDFSSTAASDKKIVDGASEVSVERLAKNTVDVSIDGKVYHFTKDDLRQDDREDRFRKEFKEGDEIQSIRVSRTNDNQKRVEMWQVGIYRPKADTYEEGYLINGERPEKLATTGTAKYGGGFGWGNMRNKTKPFDDRKGFWGRLELNADFGKSTIDGKLFEIRTEDENDNEINIKGEVAITGGKITESDFTANVATNKDLDTSLGLGETAKGEMKGGFYGHYGSEAAGTIAMENKTYKGQFAFDAREEN